MIFETYEKSAIEYGRAISSGDRRESDAAYREIESAFRKIKKEEDKWIDRLAELLKHPEESVRLWAAAHLLNYRKEQAEGTLQNIIDAGSIIGLTAEVTMDRWKSGQLEY